MKRSAIRVASADVKFAEVSGVVTVGPETAARLGVPVGTQVDLGTLAVYHRNPVRRFLANLRLRRPPL